MHKVCGTQSNSLFADSRTIICTTYSKNHVQLYIANITNHNVATVYDKCWYITQLPVVT